MFDKEIELSRMIALGEDNVVEFKEVQFSGQKVSAPHRNSLADELAAFANGRGGICILGVDDSRKIIGIPLDKIDLAEDFVRQICLDSINPPLMANIEKLFVQGSDGIDKAVIKIEIERSLFVHSSPGGYLYRVGSAKRMMQPDYLARLFQQRSQSRIIRFDEQPVPKATLDDLSLPLWKRFSSSRVQEERDVLLDKLGMARKDADGVIRPTVAGVLMAAENPQEWLPNAFIQAVAYRGTTIRPEGDEYYQLDAKDIFGPLDQQVMEACQFVRRNMRIMATKKLGRKDIPQYDMNAVFEALVNAVAHRDYSIYGAKIRLRMFDDRLEIYSPGSIPNTMTVESLPYRQAVRNEVLTSLLAQCYVPQAVESMTERRTMMDKRGEGVRIILDQSEKLSGKLPQYRLIDDSELLLIISAAGSDLLAEEGSVSHV